MGFGTDCKKPQENATMFVDIVEFEKFKGLSQHERYIGIGRNDKNCERKMVAVHEVRH